MKSNKRISELIRIMLMVLPLMLLIVFMWTNTYFYHTGIMWLIDAPVFNIDLSSGAYSHWTCEKENMEFVAEDYIRPEPYVEMEIANGTLITEDGEESEFHIEFEAESYDFVLHIGEDEYKGIGYFDVDDDKYTLIFNHKNWPKEYLGKTVRPITFVEKY